MAYRRRLSPMAGVLLLLCGATAAEGDSVSVSIVGSPPERTASAKPKYCSKREHLGVTGQLVDQAWVIYRRLEISSPQRKGWCACAKGCEPIDELAADYEASAYAAREASRNLSLSSEQRGELAEQSIDLFGQRNEMVERFNACIDRTRPPLSGKDSDVLAALRKPIPGSCSKSDRPLAERWAEWCKAFVDLWKPIADDFSTKFETAGLGTYELHVPLMATDKGKISQNAPEVFSTNVPKGFRDDIRKRLAAIEMDPFPDGTKLAAISWVSTMRVVNVKGKNGHLRLNQEMPCPKN
jgi:hypothetical protein